MATLLLLTQRLQWNLSNPDSRSVHVSEVSFVSVLRERIPFERHISLNKQKSTYNILTPSIIAVYKFLCTYGGSGHIYAHGLLRVKEVS